MKVVALWQMAHFYSKLLPSMARYGQVNTHDLLKCYALLIMTVDHVGYFLYPDALWLRAVGRVATLVWFFLAGYSRPSRIITYELVVAALLVTAMYGGFKHMWLPCNVLLSIMCCRLFTQWCAHKGADFIVKRLDVLTVMLIIWLLPLLFLFEYGGLALLAALWGYLHRLSNEQVISRRISVVYAVLNVALYCAVQIFWFGFSPAQGLLVVVAVAALAWGMLHYRPQPLPVLQLSPWLATPIMLLIMLLGRYSLHYYVLHIAVLGVLSVWL